MYTQTNKIIEGFGIKNFTYSNYNQTRRIIETMDDTANENTLNNDTTNDETLNNDTTNDDTTNDDSLNNDNINDYIISDDTTNDNTTNDNSDNLNSTNENSTKEAPECLFTSDCTQYEDDYDVEPGNLICGNGWRYDRPEIKSCLMKCESDEYCNSKGLTLGWPEGATCKRGFCVYPNVNDPCINLNAEEFAPSNGTFRINGDFIENDVLKGEQVFVDGIFCSTSKEVSNNNQATDQEINNIESNLEQQRIEEEEQERLKKEEEAKKLEEERLKREEELQKIKEEEEKLLQEIENSRLEEERLIREQQVGQIQI